MVWAYDKRYNKYTQRDYVIYDCGPGSVLVWHKHVLVNVVDTVADAKDLVDKFYEK